MDTEGVFASSTFQLTEENHFIVHFLHRHIVVLDTLEGFLHLVQFMIMGGKQGACFRFRMFVDILYDGPGNRNTVISRRTAPQLIE